MHHIAKTVAPIGFITSSREGNRMTYSLGVKKVAHRGLLVKISENANMQTLRDLQIQVNSS